MDLHLLGIKICGVFYNEFFCFVKHMWLDPTHGSGLIKLATKLKRTKVALKMWDRTVFGQVDKMIKELETHLSLVEENIHNAFSTKVEEEYILLKMN